MKTVKIQVALHDGWNKPTRFIECDGIPTIIPGLYFARPLGSNELPSNRGWHIQHKSGWHINPIELSSLPKAKDFISRLNLKWLDWDKSIEELQADYKTYTQAIREVLEEIGL